METISHSTNSIDEYCKIHNIKYLICAYENCKETQVCKLCSLNSKEGIQHLYEHYEQIKNKPNKFTTAKDDEFFIDINEAFVDFKNNFNNYIEEKFEKINISKSIILEQSNEFLTSNYEETTNSFENLVKTLSDNLSKLNTNDMKSKDEIKRIKQELDSKLNYLTNKNEITKELDNFKEKVEKKLNSISLIDFMSNKFNFSKNNLNVSLNWERDGHVFTNLFDVKCPTGVSSYWCIRSQEILEGAFICKVKIININASKVNDYWNYCFGLSRINIKSESSYYNDSVLFQSNGHTNVEFSGSSSGTKLNLAIWKSGDILVMSRNSNGNVFFGINDEKNLHQAFTILEPMRIVLGFSIIMSGDTFEMIELNKQ